MEVDELFDAWERAWSGRELRGFESICAKNVHYEDPLTPAPLIGWGALAVHAKRLWQAMPDARVNSTGARLSRRDVRLRAVPRARHPHRPARPDPPDGPRARGPRRSSTPSSRRAGCLRVRAFFDVYAAAMELGVLPKPGTAGERALLVLRGFGLRG